MAHVHVGRGLVVGAAVSVLSGVGIAAATSPPTEPSDDTAMETGDTGAMTVDTGMTATSAPMAGGGPSDCPPIPAAAEEPTDTGAAGDTAPTDTGAADATAPVDTGATDMTAPADTGAADMTAPADTGAADATEGPFVQIAESEEYGPIVVDSACVALYVFTPDSGGTPTCVEDCAENWPPLTVEDGTVPPVADELDPALFSVVEHPEAGPQLAFNGWPLYYFAGDSAPGDLNGQGIGGNWWLVSDTGMPLEEGAPDTAPIDTGTGTEPMDTSMGTMPADSSTETTG